MRRTVAGGTGGGADQGCSRAGATDERGGAAAAAEEAPAHVRVQSSENFLSATAAVLSAHAAAKTARAARESGKGCHARAPSSLPHGGRPERRSSGVDEDAEEEVDEAAAMVTIEVLDAVAVHEGDAHHHEAVVVEAELVGEWRSWKPGFQRFE